MNPQDALSRLKLKLKHSNPPVSHHHPLLPPPPPPARSLPRPPLPPPCPPPSPSPSPSPFDASTATLLHALFIDVLHLARSHSHALLSAWSLNPTSAPGSLFLPPAPSPDRSRTRVENPEGGKDAGNNAGGVISSSGGEGARELNDAPDASGLLLFVGEATRVLWRQIAEERRMGEGAGVEGEARRGEVERVRSVTNHQIELTLALVAVQLALSTPQLRAQQQAAGGEEEMREDVRQKVESLLKYPACTLPTVREFADLFRGSQASANPTATSKQ